MARALRTGWPSTHPTPHRRVSRSPQLGGPLRSSARWALRASSKTRTLTTITKSRRDAAPIWASSSERCARGAPTCPCGAVCHRCTGLHVLDTYLTRTRPSHTSLFDPAAGHLTAAAAPSGLVPPRPDAHGVGVAAKSTAPVFVRAKWRHGHEACQAGTWGVGVPLAVRAHRMRHDRCTTGRGYSWTTPTRSWCAVA